MSRVSVADILRTTFDQYRPGVQAALGLSVPCLFWGASFVGRQPVFDRQFHAPKPTTTDATTTDTT